MMLRFAKNKKNTFISYLLIGFILLFLLKWGAIFTSYSYLLAQMQWRWIGYFIVMVFQTDVFLMGILLALAYGAEFSKKRWIKIGLKIIVFLALLIVFLDVVAMFVYQQRFSFVQISGMISNATGIIWIYLLYFLFGLGFLIGAVFLIARWVGRPLTKHAIFILIGCSIVVKLLPMPILHVSGGELPVENIFAQRFKEYYELNLSDQTQKKNKLEKSDFSAFLSGDHEHLDQELKSWLRVADHNPVSIFEEFPQEKLVTLRDAEGKLFYKQVLYSALRKNPELAFLYINNYKDRKDVDGDRILKDILEFAITQNPQLAYSYLPSYEELIEYNEKIAKPLLERATALYENKLNFKDLFVKEKGRNNKKNLILVFFESASAVDSRRTGGLYNKFPQTDTIAKEGVMYTNMFANGVTSEMGHISTLMGVEPMFLGASLKTGYERFTGAVDGLGTFFKKLGYKTHFVSTASLDFLNQRSFLKKVGFDKLWEDGFIPSKTYTFNAAPDEVLYQKTLDVVKSQTSPYFLSLQTISSHTPYSTPYGNSADEAFRYMDESFAKFYIQLKASGFFDNGVLVVVGDHRKMTPIGADEYAKRGAGSEGRIMAFMIGSGIKAGVLDDKLYQQTDIFYSLMKEFGSGEVSILEQSNDLFTQEAKRNRAIKNFTVQQRAYSFNVKGDVGNIDIPTRNFTQGADNFDAKAIANYLYLAWRYQKDQNPEDSVDVPLYKSTDAMTLIAHRGDHSDTTENSYAAFLTASRYGADALEFDVTATKDGKLVVFHGPKTYNTSCKQRVKDICQMTYEELKECTLDNGEHILLLSERLPKIKFLFPLFFLDLKISQNSDCNHLDAHVLLEQAKKIVAENQMQEQVVFSSDSGILSEQLGQDGEIISALDANGRSAIPQLASGGYLYFMAPYQTFTSAMVDELRQIRNKYGQKIIPVAYTVNDIAQYRRLKSLGIRYIMTDKLMKLKEEESK